jgi:predicted transcriptional regulator
MKYKKDLKMKIKNTNNKDFQKVNNENSYYNQDAMLEIKDLVKDIQKDLKNMLEKSNEEYLNFMYSSLKNEFINSMNGYMLDKIDPELEERMVNPCDMREQCKSIFRKYLKKHTDDLTPDNISNGRISKSLDEFEIIKKNKQKEDCNICFNEVSNIFESHVGLIKSIQLYDNQKDDDEKKISDIDEKKLVKSVLTPISHEKRLKILKSIASEPQTFSSLSNLVSLKGGNLIFHIDKLQKSDLIFQKQDHKEYMLTTKGFKVIQLLLNIES